MLETTTKKVVRKSKKGLVQFLLGGVLGLVVFSVASAFVGSVLDGFVWKAVFGGCFGVLALMLFVLSLVVVSDIRFAVAIVLRAFFWLFAFVVVWGVFSGW